MAIPSPWNARNVPLTERPGTLFLVLSHGKFLSASRYKMQRPVFVRSRFHHHLVHLRSSPNFIHHPSSNMQTRIIATLLTAYCSCTAFPTPPRRTDSPPFPPPVSMFVAASPIPASEDNSLREVVSTFETKTIHFTADIDTSLREQKVDVAARSPSPLCLWLRCG